MNFCKNEIEIKNGRVKTIENGPRTIDVDILLYDDEEVHTNDLDIPHPRLFERAFVLVPLKELAPDVVGDINKYTLVDTIDGVVETEYDLGEFLNKFIRDENEKSWA